MSCRRHKCAIIALCVIGISETAADVVVACSTISVRATQRAKRMCAWTEQYAQRSRDIAALAVSIRSIRIFIHQLVVTPEISDIE